MFRIIALRVAGAMMSVLAGLCALVTVLAVIVWAKGGSEADGMPQLAGGFLVGCVVCVGVVVLVRRRSRQVEADLDAHSTGGQD